MTEEMAEKWTMRGKVAMGCVVAFVIVGLGSGVQVMVENNGVKNDFVLPLNDLLYVDSNGNGQIDDSEMVWGNFTVRADATGDKAVAFEEGDGFKESGSYADEIFLEDYDAFERGNRDPASVRVIVAKTDESLVTQARYGDVGNGNAVYGFGYEVVTYSIYDVKTGKTIDLKFEGNKDREPPGSLSRSNYAGIDQGEVTPALHAEIARLLGDG